MAYTPQLGDDGYYDGTFQPSGAGYPEFLEAQFGKMDWESKKINLENELKKNQHPDADALTAYGVALVHMGESWLALPLFLELEATHPGHYPNAANLGTTYELLGDDVNALKWIKEGIKRNPGSHQGTEWLHEKILEAKINLRKDPRWLELHSISGYDWGGGSKATKPADLTTEKAARLNMALHHQLYERLQFVKAPDPVVGQLLFDLGNLAALSSQPVYARQLFAYSLHYSAPQPAHVQKRMNAYRVEAWIHQMVDAPLVLLGFSGLLSAGFFLGIAFFFAYKGKQKRLNAH